MRYNNNHNNSNNYCYRRSNCNSNNGYRNNRSSDELTTLMRNISNADGSVVPSVEIYQTDQRALYLSDKCTFDLAYYITSHERMFFRIDDGGKRRRCSSLYKYLQCIFKCQMYGREVRHVTYYQPNPNRAGNNNNILVFHTNLQRDCDGEQLYFVAIKNSNKYGIEYRSPTGYIGNYCMSKAELMKRFNLRWSDIPQPTNFNFYRKSKNYQNYQNYQNTESTNPNHNNHNHNHNHNHNNGQDKYRSLLNQIISHDNNINNQTGSKSLLQVQYWSHKTMSSHITGLWRKWQNSNCNKYNNIPMSESCQTMSATAKKYYIDQCLCGVQQAFARIEQVTELSELRKYVSLQVFISQSADSMRVEMLVPVSVELDYTLIDPYYYAHSDSNINNNNDGSGGGRLFSHFFAVVVAFNRKTNVLQIQRIHPLQFAFENARLLAPVLPESLLYQYYCKELGMECC
jgi:hypothetical protein